MENNPTLMAIVIALVPAILSYMAGKRSSAVTEKDNATGHWKELYETMRIERDDYRKDVEKLQSDFSELKAEVSTIKKSYEERIRILTEENIYLKDENERLAEENNELKGVV